MAAVTTLQTIDASYDGLGINSKRYVFNEVTLVLTAQGDATDNIPAAYLGLSKVRGCTCAVSDDDDVILPAAPSYDGSLLLLGGGASNAPATYTDTFKITVWGDPTTPSFV